MERYGGHAIQLRCPCLDRPIPSLVLAKSRQHVPNLVKNCCVIHTNLHTSTNKYPFFAVNRTVFNVQNSYLNSQIMLTYNADFFNILHG